MTEPSQDKIHVAPTIVKVTQTVNLSGDKGSESEDDEIIEVHKFVTQPAIIKIAYPVKKTKAYQSVGVEVGVELPCYVEEIEQGLEKAQDIVVRKVKELLPGVTAVLDRFASEAG